jgi:hypothetical protein
MSVGKQLGLDGLLVMEAGVVGTDGNGEFFHAAGGRKERKENQAAKPRRIADVDS